MSVPSLPDDLHTALLGNSFLILLRDLLLALSLLFRGIVALLLPTRRPHRVDVVLVFIGTHIGLLSFLVHRPLLGGWSGDRLLWPLVIGIHINVAVIVLSTILVELLSLIHI